MQALPFFKRCVRPADRPEWLSTFVDQHAAAGAKLGTGEVIYIVHEIDPAPAPLALVGWIICSGGRICYEVRSDAPVSNDRDFWSFAARNGYWVTPSVELRRRVAAELQLVEAISGSSPKVWPLSLAAAA